MSGFTCYLHRAVQKILHPLTSDGLKRESQQTALFEKSCTLRSPRDSTIPNGKASVASDPKANQNLWGPSRLCFVTATKIDYEPFVAFNEHGTHAKSAVSDTSERVSLSTLVVAAQVSEKGNDKGFDVRSRKRHTSSWTLSLLAFSLLPIDFFKIRRKNLGKWSIWTVSLGVLYGDAVQISGSNSTTNTLSQRPVVSKRRTLQGTVTVQEFGSQPPPLLSESKPKKVL